MREEVLAYISKSSGVATLYDVRRATDYDAGHGVDVFVNRPDVKVSAAWLVSATVRTTHVPFNESVSWLLFLHSSETSFKTDLCPSICIPLLDVAFNTLELHPQIHPAVAAGHGRFRHPTEPGPVNSPMPARRLCMIISEQSKGFFTPVDVCT